MPPLEPTVTSLSEAPLDPIIDDVSGLQSAKFVLGRNRDNPEAWKMYKKQQGSLWAAEEINLSYDKIHFAKLSENEQAFIKNVLAFFACADGIVSEHIILNMQSQCKQSSVQAFYAVQTYIEKVHQEVYNDLILTLVASQAEQDRLFSAVDNDPGISAKTNWAIRWMHSDNATFAEKLVAFACVEGIMFSSSFCAIYYLKSRGKEMNGLFASNHFISRDEGLHTEFACLLHTQLARHNQCSPDRIKSIVMDAVEAEKVFVCSSLKLGLINMNSDMMIEYVQCVANTLLRMLKCPKAYPLAQNPFDFMESISLATKANFFESTETNYQMANVGVTEEDRKFCLDAEF